jgi:hypothetical protein
VKRIIIAAVAALALAGCQSRGGMSPLYSANSQVSAINMLLNTLGTTAGSLTRANCGGMPCQQPASGRVW